eukprot:1378737-Amorphochlora_amoeboformis.AAC.1
MYPILLHLGTIYRGNEASQRKCPRVREMLQKSRKRPLSIESSSSSRHVSSSGETKRFVGGIDVKVPSPVRIQQYFYAGEAGRLLQRLRLMLDLALSRVRTESPMYSLLAHINCSGPQLGLMDVDDAKCSANALLPMHDKTKPLFTTLPIMVALAAQLCGETCEASKNRFEWVSGAGGLWGEGGSREINTRAGGLAFWYLMETRSLVLNRLVAHNLQLLNKVGTPKIPIILKYQTPMENQLTLLPLLPPRKLYP